jgi:nucleoside 2-deoxyribosyltransferase
LAAIHRCDYLVAYITAPDCYGTIAEIQYAHMVGKPVFIAFAPGLASKTNNHFWFVSDPACCVFYDVDAAGLNGLLSKIVQGGTHGV